MPGTTNFKQVNPNANNQENDAAYTADTARSGGMAIGTPFSSALANKIFFQFSTFATAFANSLTAKGLSPNDGSAAPGTAVATLAAVFANICVVAADIANALGYVPANDGLLNQLNNVRVQHGATSTSVVSFPVAFSSTPDVALGNEGGSANIQSGSVTRFGFSINFSFGGQVVHWVAVGPK